jgi:ABC-type enterochelin transport system ATPase subunit
VTHDINFALSCHDNILALIDKNIGFRGKKELFCDNAADHLSKIFSVNFDGVALTEEKMLYFTQGGAL